MRSRFGQLLITTAVLSSIGLPNDEAAAQLDIDNDIEEGAAGHLRVGVESAGESRDGTITVLLDDQPVSDDFIFDYFSYVDPGEIGDAFRLSLFGDPPARSPSDPDSVSSSGAFPGQNGMINWTVVSSILDGGDTMTNVFTFVAEGTTTFGPMRLYQYLDEDVDDSDDNVFFFRGAAAEGNLQLFTISNERAYGASHSGGFSSGQGLLNATFAGFAADRFDNMRPLIEGAGQLVDPAGVINTDLDALPPFEHPDVGDAFGPNDVVSVLAWDLAPGAARATVVTTLTGVPADVDLDPPVCESLVFIDDVDPPFEGTATDNLPSDTGVNSVALEGSTNLALEVVPPEPNGEPSVSFTVRVVNAAFPAAGTVRVTDGAENFCDFSEIHIPILHSSQDLSDTPVWGEGIDIAVIDGSTLAFVATWAGDLVIEEISVPSSTTPVAVFDADAQCSDASRLEDVTVLDGTAYIAAEACGLLVADVSVPEAPDLLHPPFATPFAKDAAALVDESGTWIVVADYFAGLLIIERPADGEAIQSENVRTVALTGNAVAVHVHGGLVYVATTHGLFRIDPRPDAEQTLQGGVLFHDASVTVPQLIGQGPGTIVPQDVVVRQAMGRTLAYVAGWQGGILVVDDEDLDDGVVLLDPDARDALVALEVDPADPSQLGFAAYKLASDQNFLFATLGTCGLAALDLARDGDGNPVRADISRFPINDSACDGKPVGQYAWAIAANDGLVGISWGSYVSTPPAPNGGGYQVVEYVGPIEAVVGGGSSGDGDGDGLPDLADNCTETPNPGQADADFDGYGDACDADYDNDGTVGNSDMGAFRAALGTALGHPRYDPALDHNGDGRVGNPDIGVLRNRFGSAPGPSGLACAGTTPCP